MHTSMTGTYFYIRPAFAHSTPSSSPPARSRLADVVIMTHSMNCLLSWFSVS